MLRINRVLFIFFMFLHPLEKELPVNPLHPSEISGFKPPSPLEFPVTFRARGGGGGGGVWIFSGTTQSSDLLARRSIIITCNQCMQHFPSSRAGTQQQNSWKYQPPFFTKY